VIAVALVHQHQRLADRRIDVDLRRLFRERDLVLREHRA
jgi:hypothetical protein